MYRKKKIIDFILKKISVPSINIDECLYLLKKHEKKNGILIEKEGRLLKLTSKQFFKEFEVEYLPNLYFQKLKILKDVVKECNKAQKRGFLAEKQLWDGILHEEYINTFYMPLVYIKWVDSYKGYGLFSLHDLKKNTYIGEYTGQVRKLKKSDKKNSYLFEYQVDDEKKSKYTIDAKYMSNYTRFINHSANPNLTPFVAFSKGIVHIILKTNKFIPRRTEFSYDYGPRYWKKRETPV